MSKTKAAYKILSRENRPLHFEEITRIALDEGLIVTKGKTPAQTMRADMYNENKRREKRGRSKRFKDFGKGIWGLA